MSRPLSEYFTQEAGEYLDHLDALLGASGIPDADRLFRVARGVRGSAQIAGVSGVAVVAERLEDAARAMRAGTLAWDEQVRARAVATLADLRTLVAASDRWSEAEDDISRQAAARWDGTHAEPRHVGAASGDLLAFVSREVGGVAQEIETAMERMRADPSARDPLRQLLRRMRPVRGVTGHPDLAPVLEVMEGVEDASGDLLARSGPAGGTPMDVLSSARDALRSAVDLLSANAGLDAMAQLEAFRTARDRLDGEDPIDPDVIPVSRLFDAGEGSHIVSSPTAPVRDLAGDGIQDDVVSFLRIEATGFLDRAEALIAASEHDPRRRLGRIARQLSDLATGVRELAATYGMQAIAAAADDAAARLRRAANPAEARAALHGLRTTLPAAGEPAAAEPSVGAAPVPATPESAPAAEPTPPQSTEPATPMHSAQTPDEGVVPIESLLYAPADALHEALTLRGRIEGMVGPAGRVGAPLGDLIDELFGLLTLARGSLPTA